MAVYGLLDETYLTTNPPNPTSKSKQNGEQPQAKLQKPNKGKNHQKHPKTIIKKSNTLSCPYAVSLEQAKMPDDECHSLSRLMAEVPWLLLL